MSGRSWTNPWRWPPRRVLAEIRRLIGHACRFAFQIARRVLEEEAVPHGEKLFSSVPIVLQIPPGMSSRFRGLQPPAEAPERAARRGEAGGPVRIFRFVDDDVESTRPRPGTGPAMREVWEGSGNPGRRRRGLEQARGEDCPRFPCFPHSCGAADPERHAASFRSSALLLSRRSSMSR